MLDGKRAYICSPLSATTKEVRQQNMEKAKFYLMQKVFMHTSSYDTMIADYLKSGHCLLEE